MITSTQSLEPEVYFKDGTKYQEFRPIYPVRLIEKIRSAPRTFRNYLDIATGTGQVLFQVYDCFNGLVIGADISESLLKVAKNKSNELAKLFSSHQEFKFIQGDCQNIDNLLQNNEIKAKFDLITVGEAFHWFDMESLLKTIKDCLLDKEGVLAILSYVIQDIEFNTQDEKLKQQVSQAYLQFYQKVTVYSKFDQKLLYSGYENVPFSSYFKVEKEREVQKIPSRIEDIVGHLGTWSMYNTYIEKHSKDDDYQDPLQVFKNIIEIALKESQENKSLNDSTQLFFMVIPYDLILARNKLTI